MNIEDQIVNYLKDKEEFISTAKISKDLKQGYWKVKNFLEKMEGKTVLSHKSNIFCYWSLIKK